MTALLCLLLFCPIPPRPQPPPYPPAIGYGYWDYACPGIWKVSGAWNYRTGEVLNEPVCVPKKAEYWSITDGFYFPSDGIGASYYWSVTDDGKPRPPVPYPGAPKPTKFFHQL